MKTSGVSLIPAASPVAMPLNRRLSGWRRSQMIAAISSRLICPRYSVRKTGSVSSPAATPSSAPPRRTRRSR